MANRKGFKARSAKSYDRQTNTRETQEKVKEPFIVLSFRNFDRQQGQRFAEWEKEEILALAITKLSEICQFTLVQATSQQIIKQYPKNTFPPKSDFTHPNHVPKDIAWCSVHIQGKECVIGYFEENIFYIVFLDMHHKFWITEKKS